MTGNSEAYHHQFEMLGDRFDNDELVRRYRVGEFLYYQERKDAERIMRIRAEKAEKHSEFVAIALPVLAELAAVALFIACGAVWTVILTKGV